MMENAVERNLRYERSIKHTFLDFQQTVEFLKAPLVLHKADGLYYWDTAGKRYFDAIGGIFVAGLGHRHPRVMQAMRRQMDRMTFAPPLHGIADTTLEFIETLGRVAPGDLSFVKPYSGGSESIESALKFARQYFQQTGCPKKYKFVSFHHSYHGSTYGAMAAGGLGKRKAKFEPQMGGFVKAFLPNHYRDDFPRWEDANRFAARQVESVILAEDSDTVAGVIIEPISNTAGIITPTTEFFQMLRAICDRHRVLLIYDEVITGYARTGNMFAAQTFDVVPDILCAGKGLASGAIPLGAMLTREGFAEAFWGPNEADVQFAHGNTFAGNPLACAVGIAVINEIVEQDLCSKARELGEYLRQRLERLSRFGVVREVRGKGMLWGVEFVEDAATNRPFPTGRKLGTSLKRTALRNGLILRVDPDWFAVAPALTATRKDIDELCELIEKSVEEALEMV